MIMRVFLQNSKSWDKRLNPSRGKKTLYGPKLNTAQQQGRQKKKALRGVAPHWAWPSRKGALGLARKGWPAVAAHMSSRIGHGRRGRRNCSFLKNKNNGVHGDRKQEVAAAGLFPPDHARSRRKGARANRSRHEESRQGLQAANTKEL